MTRTLVSAMGRMVLDVSQSAVMTILALAAILFCTGSGCPGGTCESNCESSCVWEVMMALYDPPCDEACRAEEIGYCTERCLADTCGYPPPPDPYDSYGYYD